MKMMKKVEGHAALLRPRSSAVSGLILDWCYDIATGFVVGCHSCVCLGVFAIGCWF